MGMAQMNTRPRNEIQLLSDVDLLTLNDTRTGSGVIALRTIAAGQTFVMVKCIISITNLAAAKTGVIVSIEFGGVVIDSHRFPVSDTGGDSFNWPTPFSGKGLEFVGDGVDVLEIRLASGSNVPISVTMFGYERNT